MIGSLLLLGVVSASCDLFNDDAIFVPDTITGTWTWQRTAGGFIGEVIDADSVDYSMRLVIREDATAAIYRNNEITASFIIKYEEKEWLWKNEPTWIFYRQNGKGVPKFVTSVHNGKLVLQDACTDCYTMYFSRK